MALVTRLLSRLIFNGMHRSLQLLRRLLFRHDYRAQSFSDIFIITCFICMTIEQTVSPDISFLTFAVFSSSAVSSFIHFLT